MHKKLTDKQVERILDCATELFGKYEPARVAVSQIAMKADVSVGVIYKYFGSKQALVDACLSRSLSFLDRAIERAVSDSTSLADFSDRLAKAAVSFSKKHPSCIRMYHVITATGSEKSQRQYARKIESGSLASYTETFAKAQKKGLIREDMSPSFLAFFFDNLLMMLQFSAGCGYYEERRSICCGDADDQMMLDQFSRFIQSALGLRGEQPEGK